MSAAHASSPVAFSFEVPRHECLDLIRGEPVGRICILEHGVPIALPVNYQVTGDGGDVAIVFRTAPETEIGRYHGVASLEVDRIDVEAGRAWSVIVRGHLRPVLGEPGPTDFEPLLRTGRSRLMTLDVGAVSGRRFLVWQDDGFAVEWQVEQS